MLLRYQRGLCENDCTDYGALPLILLAACIAGLVAALFVGRRAWRTYCREVSPENYPTFRTAAMVAVAVPAVGLAIAVLVLAGANK